MSTLLDLGVPLEQIPMPEAYMPLDPQERRGREVFKAACEGCHGAATTDRIVNREVQALFFPAHQARRQRRFQVVPGVGPVPVFVSRPDVEIVNYGFGIFSYLGQLGLFPAFNASVELPRYRFRFYEDGTRDRGGHRAAARAGDRQRRPPRPHPRPRRERRAHRGSQPPAPALHHRPRPRRHHRRPGRLRGLRRPPAARHRPARPPYFHDNSHDTLKDVVDTYSRFVLPVIPPLNLPRVNPPELPGLPPESLTPAQKDDLMAFLERL